MSLYVTDEPEVTEDTRFWLFFEIADCGYTRKVGELHIHRGERLRIKVEVDEATYRAKHAEAHPAYGDTVDFTAPLDDHWWSSAGLPTPHYLTHTIHRTRGGYIDWWGA